MASHQFPFLGAIITKCDIINKVRGKGEKMQKLIKKYIKNPKPSVLHKIRIKARKKLSVLEKNSKTDLALKELLKKSSKLRDTDVLLKICDNKKIKKILKQKRKKYLEKFIKYLKKFEEGKIIPLEKQSFDFEYCKNLLKKTFLDKSDKELHELRIEIKKCRYTCKKYEKEFKRLQDALGKIHDYYNCIKLLKKYNQDYSTIAIKKKELIFKAEKIRKEIKDFLE
jgi:CHAD domain-containing protein